MDDRQLETKILIEQLKQASNIWAMLAAASLAAMFFQGEIFWGIVLGAYSVKMCFSLIRTRIQKEEEMSCKPH